MPREVRNILTRCQHPWQGALETDRQREALNSVAETINTADPLVGSGDVGLAPKAARRYS